MADVTGRDEKEAQIARVLGKEFNRARLELLGLIPELDRWLADVPQEFWDAHRTNLRGGLTPVMASIYLAQAEVMLQEFSFLGVDWGLVNAGAADWAKDYAFELVRGLTDTSRRTLQKLIPQFFEQQWTQGQLREQLAPTFGAVRAESIARTEVTRAAAQGEEEVLHELEDQGIQMTPIWNTREDEIVCPICGALNGRPADGRDENGRPSWTLDGVIYTLPAHPRDRCWETYELIRED